MKIELASLLRVEAQHFRYIVLEGQQPMAPFRAVADKRAFTALLSELPDSGGRWRARRELAGRSFDFASAGSSDGFDVVALRASLAQALAAASQEQVKTLALIVPNHEVLSGAPGLARTVRALRAAAYRFAQFRALDGPDQASFPETVVMVPPTGSERSWRAELPRAEAVAAGVKLARDLGNTPPNVATPEYLASEAKKLARRYGGNATVLGPAQLEKRGMGGILAVGAGSANSPRMVRLELGDKGPSIALVGKGVTFDTGGISIKPSAAMEEMKYDKCGACAVLGIAEAVGRLSLPVRLRVYLPLAENMPDGLAYRPSDIVTCYDGTTVEIHNTDAEGRMILADAIAWAIQEEPWAIVDYATLTGACVVALGEGAAALYARDEKMADALITSAETAGERLWQLPLWPEFVEQMKGDHADLKNSGPRWGGANTAAAFLSHFAGDHPRWAHVDLAGPAYAKKSPEIGEAGATGYGVALTIDWLRNLSRRSA